MNVLRSSVTGRAVVRARVLQVHPRRYASESATTTVDAEVRDQTLRKGARRDPELYILLAIMSGAFGLAGWFFARKPTSSSSEAKVALAEGSMPWQSDGAEGGGKYSYHPGGDKSKAVKDAPSAVNTVIVPNVTLPKRLHDKYNKWGKDGY